MLVTRRNAITSGAALAAAGMLPGWALAAAGKDPVVNRIALEDGRIWIVAKIGDKGPFYFVIDTGAFVSFIDNDFAKSLALPTVLSRPVYGTGGVSDMPWYNAGTVTLSSGTRFPDMLFAGLRQRPSKDAVGTFGAGLFTTFDSDLDFGKGEWRAYPDGRPNFNGLTKLDSRFTKERGGQRILADVTLDAFTGTFLVDTGSPGELSLDGRASAKSGLWDDARPYAPMHARGIGKGRIPSRIVRAGRMKIGPFVFEKPLVVLNKPGSISSSEHDGIIGLTTLARLNLTTDVSKAQLYAAPSGLPEPKRGYPLAGIVLEGEAGRVTVDDVGTGSPAAKAGLKAGDVLVGEIGALNQAINGRPGKEVALTVDRGGTKSEVRYVLADYL